MKTCIQQSEKNNGIIHINKTKLMNTSKISKSKDKYPHLQPPFPITEIRIPSPQLPFTNLSSLNIKDNSLYHPLRHQQSI